MLRGLLIRQTFLAFELLLTVAILGVAGAVLAQVFEEEERLSTSAGTVSEPPAPAKVLRDPTERSHYAALEASDLFGSGAHLHKDDPAESQEPATEVETQLPLRLFGTVATSNPTDPLSTAVIENGDDKTLKTYYLHEAVWRDQVILAEVYKERVKLYNQSSNTYEILRAETELPGDSPAGPVSTARPGPGRPGSSFRPPPPGPGTPIVVKRESVVKEVQENYSKLYDELKPREAHDRNGNVIGITADNIEQVELARRFGFKNGDVIQEINGVKIGSVKEAIEVMNRFQNDPSQRVVVMRNGRSQMLSFSVE